MRNHNSSSQECFNIRSRLWNDKRRSCGAAIHITATTMATICAEKSKSVEISMIQAAAASLGVALGPWASHSEGNHKQQCMTSPLPTYQTYPCPGMRCPSLVGFDTAADQCQSHTALICAIPNISIIYIRFNYIGAVILHGDSPKALSPEWNAISLLYRNF